MGTVGTVGPAWSANACGEMQHGEMQHSAQQHSAQQHSAQQHGAQQRGAQQRKTQVLGAAISRAVSRLLARGLAIVGTAMALGQGGSSSARAATIVGYDAANSTTSSVATEWISGVTPLALSRGSGLVAGSGATFNSLGWTGEATDYLEWGWSASPAMDLQDLSVRYDRSTSGPAIVTLWLAVNGGPFQSVYQDADVDVNGEELVGLSLASFTNVTSATFRLTGANASGSTGTLDIEPLAGVTPARGIVVRGAAVVPEPTGLAWSASSGLAAIAWNRRRARKSQAAKSQAVVR